MGDLTSCQIVFRGARMKRRCMDLPVPKVLVYRKLDCKTHHCNFTLLHPTVREAFSADTSAKSSVAIKMYGGKSATLILTDTVIPQLSCYIRGKGLARYDHNLDVN